MMKRFFISILLVFPMMMTAQEPLVLGHLDCLDIFEEIRQVNNNTTKVVSRLRQERYVALLKKHTSSEAHFQYAPKRMSIIYDTPEGDSFIINGMQVMVTSKGKHRVMDGNEGMAKMLRIMLMAAMTGDYEETQYYAKSKKLHQTARDYIIELELDSKKARGGICKVEARYDKTTKRIHTIIMHQSHGGYTSYTLEDIKLHASLDESKFMIGED